MTRSVLWVATGCQLGPNAMELVVTAALVLVIFGAEWISPAWAISPPRR